MSKNLRPYMTKAEWGFLKSFLDKSHTFLEYGSGRSTVCIAPLVKEIWSIEHHTDWYNTVLEMTRELNNVKLQIVPQDHPRSNPTKLKEFKTYVDWIKNKTIKFDRVLIDGRARVWCGEAVLNNLANDHIVFLHDYNLKERPYYKEILNFYKIIDQKDYLIAMVKK